MANELKALLAYLVVSYDFKIEGDGPRPSNVYFAESVVPNPTAKVMFRKRSTASIAA